MGFIDWHGNKEDHFEDVLDYAKERIKEGEYAQRDKSIRAWMGKLLGKSEYSQLKSSDAMKLFVKEYILQKNAYSELICREHGKERKIDPNLLWEDLWLTAIDEILDKQGLSGQKKAALMQAMQDKVLHLKTSLSAEEYLNHKESNLKYARYLKNAFSFEADSPMQFWRWISFVGKSRNVLSFVLGYKKLRLLLAYYLYLSGEPGMDWILEMETDSQYLDNMAAQIKRGDLRAPEYRKLRNPLAAETYPELRKLSRMFKVLFFQIKKKMGNEEGDIRMVEELYIALEEGILELCEIESIFPKDISAQIEHKELPVFPKPELQEISSDEDLHYMNHTILYQGKEQDGEVTFRNFKGTVYFTNKRILFRGSGNVDFSYENIERVVEYDLLPELLEVTVNGRSNFFQLPDVESAYQILKLIANKNRGKEAEEKELPYTYEELVDKADLGACIFAFEYIIAGEIPEELKNQIRELIRKLKGLNKTIERYPEKKDGIYQFLHYYVPEAVKVVVEYQRYQFAGIEEKTIQTVYQKVLAAVAALDYAVLQKIADIYHFATMDTIAQAEALRELLGQDGFVDPSYMLK